MFLCEKQLLVFLFGIAEEYFVFNQFLHRNRMRLWQALIMTRDLDLLAVFKYLFQIVLVSAKFFEFLAKFFFHLTSDLVRTLRQKNHGFKQVTIYFTIQF